MKCVLALVTAGAMILGCRQEGDPAPTALPAADAPSVQELDIMAGPAELPTPRSNEPTLEDQLGEANASPEPDLDADPQEEAQVGEPAPRDLGAELSAAIGSLEDCIQNTQSARTSALRIDATATVRPTGAIIHPSASGTGLSQAERQCVARRLGAVVLAPLGGDTSQRVITVFEIDFASPSEPTKYRVGTPDPQLRNVREPLPQRPEVAPSGRAIQEPTSRPIQQPTSRPVQEPNSRKVRGPQPRPIDGWDVDENSKEWR